MIKPYSVGHHINFSKIYNNGNTPELLYYTYILQLVYHIRRQLGSGLGLGHGSCRERYSGYL
jgi:hypothetical protein